MKNFLLSILFFSLFSCSQIGVVKTNFQPKLSNKLVYGSEDIPLLEAMKEIDQLSFDSNSSSISSSNYSFEIAEKDVKEFYATTLPQMGWQLKKQSKNTLVFLRQKEKLELEIIDKVAKFNFSSSLN